MFSNCNRVYGKEELTIFRFLKISVLYKLSPWKRLKIKLNIVESVRQKLSLKLVSQESQLFAQPVKERHFVLIIRPSVFCTFIVIFWKVVINVIST